MEDHEIRIFVTKEAPTGLHHSKPVAGQEWCAYTYLLLQEPQGNNYGTIKVIGTGPTEADVTKMVADFFNDGNLESHIPFVRVSPTGMYRHLVAGGDDRDRKEAYDIQSRQHIVSAQQAAADQRRKEMNGIQERIADLKDEVVAPEAKRDPFENYIYYRQQHMLAIQRVNALRKELKQMELIRASGATEVKRIERENGTFRLKYETQFKKTAEAEHKEEVIATAIAEVPVASAEK